jgi:hypothetical protein
MSYVIPTPPHHPRGATNLDDGVPWVPQPSEIRKEVPNMGDYADTNPLRFTTVPEAVNLLIEHVREAANDIKVMPYTTDTIMHLTLQTKVLLFEEFADLLEHVNGKIEMVNQAERLALLLEQRHEQRGDG